MSGPRLDDTTMTTSSSGLTSTVDQALRLSNAKTNSRYFAFPWKRRYSDDTNASRSSNCDEPNNMSNTKISNGFLRNIKKRLHIKNLSLCKARQKIISLDPHQSAVNVDKPELSNESSPLPYGPTRNSLDRNARTNVTDDIDEIALNAEAEACWESFSLLENRNNLEHDVTSKDERSDLRLGITIRAEARNDSNTTIENDPPMLGGNISNLQMSSMRETIEACESNAQTNESKAKVNLSEELLKLSKYGWYWGPISGDEADSKLVSEPDGAFLVRDSSDDRYLLTLSFKSSGRLLHARMEHSGGLFSLCNQSDNEGFTSVAALIDHSMNSSQSAVFCYSRPKYPGYPSFPVRLTKPVSRFTQVRSLQYLCRFVIRQNTRVDNIHKLPLPKTIRGYIEEAHY